MKTVTVNASKSYEIKIGSGLLNTIGKEAAALGKASKICIVSQFFRIYISIMRGTPLMLQLFFFYFGPYYIFGIPLSKLGIFGIEYRFLAVIMGFSLNYAAYFAEIYRGGIQSIPRGHYEAAQVLGYSSSQTFMKIVLP